MLICVTQRLRCEEPFLTRLARITALRPHAVILREKDLSETAYGALAEKSLSICAEHQVPLLLAGMPHLAEELGCGAHLPYTMYMAPSVAALTKIRMLGVSVHSVEEAAAAAQRAKETELFYIMAGHIFPTDCKKGLEPRGTQFLSAVCHAAPDIPVFGIGGITPERYASVVNTGAAGACVMSGLMTCPAQNLAAFVSAFSSIPRE